MRHSAREFLFVRLDEAKISEPVIAVECVARREILGERSKRKALLQSGRRSELRMIGIAVCPAMSCRFPG